MDINRACDELQSYLKKDRELESSLKKDNKDAELPPLENTAYNQRILAATQLLSQTQTHEQISLANLVIANTVSRRPQKIWQDIFESSVVNIPEESSQKSKPVENKNFRTLRDIINQTAFNFSRTFSKSDFWKKTIDEYTFLGKSPKREWIENVKKAFGQVKNSKSIWDLKDHIAAFDNSISAPPPEATEIVTKWNSLKSGQGEHTFESENMPFLLKSLEESCMRISSDQDSLFERFEDLMEQLRHVDIQAPLTKQILNKWQSLKITPPKDRITPEECLQDLDKICSLIRHELKDSDLYSKDMHKASHIEFAISRLKESADKYKADWDALHQGIA